MRPPAPNTPTLITVEGYRSVSRCSGGFAIPNTGGDEACGVDQTCSSAPGEPALVDRADDRERSLVGCEDAVDHPGDVAGLDGVDFRDELVEAGYLAERELASPEAVHAARRALEGECQRPAQMPLGGVELAIRDAAVGDDALELRVDD